MSYGKKFSCEYDNYFGSLIEVAIYKRDYTGDVTLLRGSEEPFSINYGDNKDFKFAPFMGSDGDITLTSTADFNLSSLYISDEREYLVKYFIDGNLEWSGWLLADNGSEPYQHFPYPVYIKATDALGTLKGIPYLDENGNFYSSKQTFLEVIVNCLKKTELNLPISTCVNIYEESMLTGLNNDPLTQAKIDPARYKDENNIPYSCFDVLKAVLCQFTATIKQVKGRFDITDASELSKPAQRRRYYTSEGVFQTALEESNTRTAPVDGELILINSDHKTRFDRPYKQVEAYYLYGYNPSVLQNGTFKNFSNGTYQNWTKTGALGLDGTFALGARITTLFNAGQFLKSAPIGVLGSDTIIFSGAFATFKGNVGKLKVILGEYQLKQDGTWAKADSYLNITPPAPDRPVYYETGGVFEITSAPVPISGQIYIQVYGVIRSDYPTTTDDIKYFELGIKKSTGSQANRVARGEVYRIAQDLDLTNIPDRILLLHGDEVDPSLVVSGTRPVRGDYSVPADEKTSNIYRADGTTITTKWNRFGKTDNKPLGLIVVRNILNNYQRPLRFFEGSFKGNLLNPLQTISIAEIPGSKFIVISGTFNSKDASANLLLAEVVSEEVIASELIYSDYGSATNATSGISSPSGVPVGGGVSGQYTVKQDLQDITTEGATTDKVITVKGLITEESGSLVLPEFFDIAQVPADRWGIFIDEGEGGSATPPTIIDSLDDLNDVTLTSPTNQQALVFDGTKWVNADITLDLESQKNIPNGIAGLTSAGLLPSSIMPSYVDDVIEGTSLANLPATGESGKIYVTTDNNKSYRWSGSTYVEIQASPGSTDAVPEGSVNKYFTDARARSASNETLQSITDRGATTDKSITAHAYNTSGIDAGYNFLHRDDGSKTWALYASANHARLWNNSIGDAFVVNYTSGNVDVNGTMRATAVRAESRMSIPNAAPALADMEEGRWYIWIEE